MTENRNAARKITGGIGPQSRPHRWAKVDGRSTLGRRLREIRRDLIEHCGGPQAIGAPQKILIDRLAVDVVRLELLDREMVSGDAFSGHDARISHALRNSIRLGLRELGMKPAAPPPIDPMAVLAAALARPPAA